MEAAESGNLEEVKRLIDTEDADACYQRDSDGASGLMLAAGKGHLDVVKEVRQGGSTAISWRS